ncbi:MAG TPA: MarR family transcriptional regulator [Tepidiformaceae bacterium]|nr:MarR family transcriptional regulator [Tepidiformaceae bacterium]
MSTTPREKAPFVGAMMRVALHWVLEQIYAGVNEAGYTDLSPAQVGMFRYPTSEGLRPSELAQRLRVTKQSVNDLLRETERLGYLALAPDPADGRARVIRLTPRGRQLEQAVHHAAGAAEAGIARLLGPTAFEEFHSALERVAEAVHDGSLQAADDRPAPVEARPRTAQSATIIP